MNIVARFTMLLLLLTVQVDGLAFQWQTPHQGSAQRVLGREEHESDSSTAGFPARRATVTPARDSAGDLSDVAAAIDALTAASNDSPLSSSSSILFDGIRPDSSEEGEFEDVGASVAAVSAFSSTGDLNATIGGDVNLEDGEDLPSSTAVTPAPYAIVASIVVAHVLLLEMAN
jgi:hypothetical protein